MSEFYTLPESDIADEVAAWELDRDACPAHGGPLEDCADPEVQLYPQRAVCEITMATLGARRLYALLHEDEPYHDGRFESWSKEPSEHHPFRYDDGVTIWVSRHDLTPDDDFLTPPVLSVLPDLPEQ